MTEQLREFLTHSDGVARGLLRLQAELDEGQASCERYVRTLRQKNQIEANPADAPFEDDGTQPVAEAFATRCRSYGHELERVAEDVRLALSLRGFGPIENFRQIPNP